MDLNNFAGISKYSMEFDDLISDLLENIEEIKKNTYSFFYTTIDLDNPSACILFVE